MKRKSKDLHAVQFTGCKRKGKARAGFFAQELYGSSHWLFKSIKAGLWEIDMMDAAEKESAKLRDVEGLIPEVRDKCGVSKCFLSWQML